MTPEMFVMLGGVFALVAVGAGGLLFVVLERRSPERRRLQQLATAGPAPVLAPAGVLAKEPSKEEQRYGRFVPKSPKEMARIQRMLAGAGYRSYWAVIAYAAAELMLPLVFAAVPILIFGLRGGFLIAAIGAGVGFVIPGLVLGRLVHRYKKGIRNGLADALDLLIVCLEAGCGLDQAILKASDELQVSYPALSDELRLINIEIRAGKPRLEAFKNFSDRTKVDDVRSLVAMLVQTDRFGTSVAQALRTHAETLRSKRRQRAEEKAAKLGVKLVFPLVFCLFPALYVVTLGPAVVQFVRVFFAQVVPGMAQ